MNQPPRPRIAEQLDLAPHPEGGWYRETWRAGPSWQPDGYPGPRAAATGIYFLLAPGEESAWHRVRSDEVWLWHHGGPLMLLDGGDGETPAAAPSVVTLGTDLAAGQAPQHVIPGGHWQSARPAGPVEALVSCVVAPGFDFADFTLLPASTPEPSVEDLAGSGRPERTFMFRAGRMPAAHSYLRHHASRWWSTHALRRRVAPHRCHLA